METSTKALALEILLHTDQTTLEAHNYGSSSMYASPDKHLMNTYNLSIWKLRQEDHKLEHCQHRQHRQHSGPCLKEKKHRAHIPQTQNYT